MRSISQLKVTIASTSRSPAILVQQHLKPSRVHLLAITRQRSRDREAELRDATYHKGMYNPIQPEKQLMPTLAT